MAMRMPARTTGVKSDKDAPPDAKPAKPKEIFAEIKTVDWPLAFRVLSSLGCICGIISDAIILTFIFKWFIGVGYHFLHQAFTDLDFGEVDLESWVGGDIKGHRLSMDFAIGVIHFYSFTLLSVLLLTNCEVAMVPAYFRNTAFLFMLETGLGVIQGTSVLGMPDEAEWARARPGACGLESEPAGSLDSMRQAMWLLRNVSGFVLGVNGTLRLLTRCCCVKIRKDRVTVAEHIKSAGGALV